MKFAISLLIALVPLNLMSQTLEECKMFMRAGSLEKAYNCFQSTQLAGSSNPSYLYNLAKLYNITENDDSAAVILSKAKSILPDNNYTRLTELMILLDSNATDKATAIAATLLESSKNEPLEFYNELGRLIIHPRLLATALGQEFGNRFKTKFTEQSADYKLYMGDYYNSKSDFGAAVNEYNSILDKNPKNIYALYGKSESYKKIKNYKSALDEINAVLALTNAFPVALKQKADLSLSLGNTQDGISFYNQYFTHASMDIKSRNQFAVQLFGAKMYQEALTQAEMILKTNPSNRQALKITAYAQHELEKYQESISTFDTYLLNADSTIIVSRDYEYLAKNYVNLMNDSMALLNYSKALELPNARAELFSEVGALYQKKGLYNEAIAVFQKKFSGSEGSVADYYNFGRALLGASNFAAADSMFDKVTQIQPEWPNGYFMRANANANLDPESTEGKAKPYYEKFIELTESDTASAKKYSKNLIEAYKYLGYYYFLNKDLKQSKAYWSKVLLIDPKDKVATEAIQKL